MGPRQAIKTYSDLIYDVKKHIGGSGEKIHCAGLFLYRLSSGSPPVSKYLLDLAGCSEEQYESGDNVVVIGVGTDGIFLHIWWLGLPSAVDRTWAALQTMYEDMTNTVGDFLHTYSHKTNERLACQTEHQSHSLTIPHFSNGQGPCRWCCYVIGHDTAHLCQSQGSICHPLANQVTST